jgi:hypothetical protein
MESHATVIKAVNEGSQLVVTKMKRDLEELDD